MNCSRKEFDGIANAIITEAAVLVPIDQFDEKFPPFHHTKIAAWDTGAQFTFISPRVVKRLNLKPYRRGQIMGIGGDKEAYTYKIHLGLPNHKMVKDLEVYSSDIDDYDVLIGMDVISLTDFLITNKENTVFSFRYPSEGKVELK